MSGESQYVEKNAITRLFKSIPGSCTWLLLRIAGHTWPSYTTLV